MLDLENLVAKLHARLAAHEALLLALFANAPSQREIRRAYVRTLDPDPDLTQIDMQLLDEEFDDDPLRQLDRQREAIKQLLGHMDAGQ